MRAATIAAALTGVLALAACSEKPQTAGQRKSDLAPATGANPAYTAGNWKAGDAAAWEAQIKARTQGQNEYERARSGSGG